MIRSGSRATTSSTVTMRSLAAPWFLRSAKMSVPPAISTSSETHPIPEISGSSHSSKNTFGRFGRHAARLRASAARVSRVPTSSSIGGSVNGEELSDLKFHPFWAKAEQLGALIFIHPQGTAELSASGRLKGNGVLENVIGNPLETTIALSHLIFEGTLDAYPGLKICAAHAGGYLPSYAARSDQGCVTFPQRCTKTLKKRPSEYLKQLYYDSLIFTPEGLRHLIAEVGASQIVLGTDYPFPWTKTAVDHILNTPGLSDDERVAMLGETAEKLLSIKPA